jgi:hypothetical protein
MKTLVAVVVCALVVFLASFVTHMLTPIGEMGMKVFPKEKEEAIIQALKSNLTESGFYFFPAIDMKNATPEQQEAWTKRYQTGPNGVLIYSANGGEAMSAGQMMREFFFALVGAFILVLFLVRMNTSLLMGGVVGALMGIFAWFQTGASEWNWYGYPAIYEFGVAIDIVIGWFLGGLAAAGILKRKS